jgi:hypothetical protein
MRLTAHEHQWTGQLGRARYASDSALGQDSGMHSAVI